MSAERPTLMPKRHGRRESSGTKDVGERVDDAYDSPSRRKLTSIACFQCRKRKCKCDGKTPCKNCIRRNTPCEYDTVSGSAHTEALKVRIRNAEKSVKDYREENLQLLGEVQRLQSQLVGRTALDEATDPGLDNTRSWEVPAVRATMLMPSYTSERSSGVSNTPVQMQQFAHGADQNGFDDSQHQHCQFYESFPCQPLVYSGQSSSESSRKTSSSEDSGIGGSTNTDLESFINHYRSRLGAGEDPKHFLNGGLDIAPLFHAGKRPTNEVSSWALQLPMLATAMSLCSRLAYAYVTYHQLQWLLNPREETLTMLPSFVQPAIAQLCIPHAISVHFVTQETRNCSLRVVKVINVVHGQHGHWPPVLLSNRIKEWDRPMHEATVSAAKHVTLSREFELYASNSSNWQEVSSGEDRSSTEASSVEMSSYPSH